MVEPMQRTRGNRRGSKQLTTTDKEIVIAVYQGNPSIRDTSMLTGVPKLTVGRIISKFRSEEGHERKCGSGHPRRTTGVDNRAIFRVIKTNRGTTTDEILDALPIFNVSNRTVRRRITASGEFKSYWKINKPFISEMNRKIRVK